jgi:hypothetical protein
LANDKKWQLDRETSKPVHSIFKIPAIIKVFSRNTSHILQRLYRIRFGSIHYTKANFDSISAYMTFWCLALITWSLLLRSNHAAKKDKGNHMTSIYPLPRLLHVASMQPCMSFWSLAKVAIVIADIYMKKREERRTDEHTQRKTTHRIPYAYNKEHHQQIALAFQYQYPCNITSSIFHYKQAL